MSRNQLHVEIGPHFFLEQTCLKRKNQVQGAQNVNVIDITATAVMILSFAIVSTGLNTIRYRYTLTIVG